MFDYAELVETVRNYGSIVPSRMGPTREKLGLQVVTIPGYIQQRHGFNKRLGYMELAQLLAGVYRPDYLARVAPNAQHGLFTPQMAYGPRALGQMTEIVRVLRNDPGTRQAVLFIGQRSDGPTSDLPCTVTIQFLRRAGFLHAIVSMRSWDLIKGLPYDLMMFGGLQMLVANVLGDEEGSLLVNAGSAHVYEEDFAKTPTPRRLAFSVDVGFSQWTDVTRTAHDFLSPDTWVDGCPPYLTEAEHAD